MTAEQTRSLVALLAIAAALCGGMYAMVADPMRERLRDAEAELADYVRDHGAAATLLADLPGVVATHDMTVERAIEIHARGTPARDESAMFAGILDLASEAGVAIEQVTPSGEQQPLVGDTLRQGDSCTRGTLSGVGSYADTAEFLRLLQSEWGYCAVRDCRMTPDFGGDTQGGVRFSIVIELYCFDASPIAFDSNTVGGTP